MNKRTEQTRWTPKRLLSLLMALIMTLSLLPTAAFAADGEASTLGTSAANPVVITFSSNQYATADTSLIKKTITEEDDTSYTVTFKPQIQFVDNSGKGTASTFIYQSGIPFKPGVSISTNAHEEKAIGQYTYTVQQVNADGTGAPNTATVTNNIHGTSKIPAASLSCEGSDFTAKALENNMIRLKYTVYEGDSASGTPVGEVYVGITGITVTDIKYTITYRPGAGADWVTTPTGLSETSESGLYATTVTPGEDGKASYTIDSAASVKKDGHTFVGWRVGANGSTGSVMKAGDTIGGITGDVNLYAELEKNHTITFQSEYSGASGLMASATSNGTKYTVPVEPTMYGFTFAGWKVTSGKADVTGNEITNITGDITLTAQWTKDGTTPVGSHTVTFLAGAADAYIPFPTPATVEDGAKYTIPTTPPTRKGYTFEGWSDEHGNTYQAGREITNVTTDIVLSAKWTATPVTIEITKDTADVTVFPRPTSGSTTTLPGAIGKTANFNVTVPAKYDTANMIVQVGPYDGEHKYLVPESQSIDNTTGAVTFHYQLKVTEDIVVDKSGVLTVSVHVGNLTEKTFTVMMPVGHFTAQIKAVDSIGSTKAEDGISASIVHGGSYTFTVTPKQGYDVEVYVNGAKKNAETDGSYLVKNVTGPQSVVVVESAIPNYNVTFTVPLSGQSFMQSVARGKTATKPGVDPEREGYTFAGWYTEAEYNKDTGAKFNFDTETITEDTVLYGKLTPNTYTITYDLNGASGTAPTAQAKKHGQAVPLSTEVPTREGFTFLGWGTTAKATAASYQPGDMYSVDGTITLYAVWEINKYTVTLPGGAGYTTAPTGTNSVDWGSNFTFTVIVDREYAAKEPAVQYSTDGGKTWMAISGTGTVSDNSAATWTYTIQGVTTDYIVSIDVARNTTYTVSFITATLDNGTVTAGDAFLKQSVEHGYYAPTPAAPEREGFKFLGYYAKNDTASGTIAGYESFPFEQQILKDTDIYAIYAPITPVITWPSTTEQVGYTMKVEYTKPGDTTATELTTNPGTVDYGSTVTFTITIDEGYDASKMLVGLNGVLFSPKDITGDTYTYEFIAKADTKITVVGIERKTITITYNANATDDVEHIPGQQILKYYLPNAADNGTLDKATPKRVGYEFRGWSTDPETNPDAAGANLYQPGGAHNFVTDTNLYAIWKATSTTVKLEVSGLRKDSAGNEGQYEGKNITLTAEIKKTSLGTPGGSMRFYKKTIDGTTVLIETVPVTGEKVTLTTPVGEFFNTSNWSETYWVEYFPEEGKGFATSKSDEVAVRVWSAAISWSISGTKIASNGDVLKVYQNTKNNEANAPGDEIADGTMIAGNVYWLEIPKVLALNGGNDPTIGHGYEILWQFMDDSGSWRNYTTTKDSNMVMIDADHSRYSFRANVVPTDPFTKAVDYKADGSLIDNQYNNAGLYTKQTKYVALQKTNTALEVTNAENEANNVKINGAMPFTADHLAQFEGQAVTLTAKVTKDGGNNGVETGYVKFYRYVDGTNDTLLNTTLISVDANGIATLEVKVSAWDTAKDAAQNLDQFYAVYETNETYETSKSDSEAVYIKSAKLMTPIIESELEGTNGAKATTYSEDLNGLLAGVQHTFTLRQTGAEATTGDWSVVALDGRTVAAKNYDIEWQYKTNGNFAKVDNDSTAVTYTTKTTEVGDQYRVVLNAKGDMTVGATSKVAEIGTKQDVTVTVKALDAITKTPETDVYQLNEITLTATVAAANDKPTMQPTGTVTFYYKDGDSWVKLDSATLAEDTNHSMTASITTNKLPVTDTTNTWRNVEITAVYEGNDTFNASGNYDATNSTVSAGTTANGVTDDTVTVYSSVVFNCNDENKKQTTNGDKGIHISVSDGVLKTNETATLALSDIYTLDRNLDKDLLNTIAKLNPTTDYTVQWQKLNGATAIGDAEGTDFANSQRWTDIGATGTTLVLDKVEQNTAYRALITVKDQPITKGSFGKLDQGVIGTADANDGRQVYYSNVLMPTDTSMTASVALNTSKIDAENTEGITEGETVTANVFLSGVVGVVPNANVTVTVTNDSAKGNDTAYEKTFTSMNTVNGWNAFSWNTAESDDNGVPTAPGFYTLTVSATTNTGYAAKEITRSLIVRESSYTIVPENTTVTYNGRTQGLTVALNGFGFNGTGINEAANKSWTVKYYDKDNNLVEPTQAGTYRAVITLPASAYWTEQTKTVDFTIEKRSVSIADAIAQAKVYDGTTDVNIVEVMLNDAETEQGTTGWLKSGENTGIINGDSIYAVATAASLNSANAGNNSFKISTIELRGDDANNYVWNEAPYTEDIYVSRSQVYGVSSTDVTLKAGEKLPADAVYMIDQAGNKITTYDVLYYLHTDTEIKKVDNTNEKGLYTVIVRPKQDNYKSGVTLKVTVGDTTSYTAAVAPKPSTLITISNTAELYGKSTGVTASTTNDAATTTIEYQSGSTGWTATAPTSAGRYLVKVTASTGDVAYGIYTITKAHPSIDVTPATGLTYNSMPQNGYTTLTGVEGKDASKDYYITYAGDVAIGYNVQKEGNVDEQAPVDAGTYTVTLHVNETENYTAHEISKSFTIAKKALTIKADSWQTTQYDAFPDMTAGYTGLAAETGDTTPDTSLRDVQIAPEFLYNPKDGKSDYSNDSLDQVGGVAIQPIDALSKNYAITYENGQYTKQRTETNVYLAIHGLPQSGDRTVNRVYFGDVIQLYPYGYYTKLGNGSAILEWSVTKDSKFKGDVTIDKDKGILNVAGVGEFTVTLKRGVGEQQIKTELTVTALKKEVKVHVTDQDKVYSGSAQTYSGEVKAYDELYATVNAATTTPANNTRTDIGTQITTSRIATGSEKYQSLVYGGQFTINDKEATVAPVADAHIYGTTRTIPSPAYTSTDSNAISNVLTASQTDAYNRLDVHDGYEILVAGTENMNYNVKYTTDHNDTAKNADDSAVTTYGGMKLYSTTTKAKNELNDATVYGEQANDLDWILDAVKSTTRDSVDYADNLADFDLTDTTGIFIKQDKDDCVGNAKTYKAANREEGNTSSTALAADRTATDTAKDDNYELKFGSVTNAKAANYTLANAEVKNAEGTMTAPTGTVGFIGAAATSDNLIEGSANIAQRPIKLEQAVTDAQLYWRLPQSQLYTALVNILKAEENSVGRGLAKGHTIEDLDLSFTIKVGSTTYNVAKDGTDAINFAATGNATVTATVGDTNYKLEGGQYQFDIVLKNIQIEATYTTKTFTGFTVLIKVHNENGTITPLNDAKGLSYKIFKKTGNTIDKTTAYASGTLTYQNRTAYDDKGGLCGVFTATYPQLPLLNSGETYFIQMYEYGVELKTNS